MSDPSAPFAVRVQVAIRPCREEDLPALEWWGLFAPHRALIREVFERHARGEATVMLVADANGMACGQAWLDLSRRRAEGIGAIWALRIFPCLRGCGLGRRLVQAAEAVLQASGCAVAEVTVEKRPPGPRGFFERLGYAEATLAPGQLAALAPPGSPPPPEGSQWVLRKRLEPAARKEPAP